MAGIALSSIQQVFGMTWPGIESGLSEVVQCACWPTVPLGQFYTSNSQSIRPDGQMRIVIWCSGLQDVWEQQTTKCSKVTKFGFWHLQLKN